MNYEKLSRRGVIKLGVGFVAASFVAGCKSSVNPTFAPTPEITPVITPKPTLPPTEAPTPTKTPEPKPIIESGPNPNTLDKAPLILKGTDGIFFTFDDCYYPQYITEIAQIALQKGVPVTFFPIGREVTQNPDLYKNLYDQGFRFGNHTWDHESLSLHKYKGIPTFDRKGNYSELFYEREYARIKDEILQQAQAIEDATGHKQLPFFRPPGGAGAYSGDENPILFKVCHDLGYNVILWSDDTNGWRVFPEIDKKATNFAFNNFKENLEPGALVLQHPEPPDTLIFSRAIDLAVSKGLKAKSVADILS